LSFAATNMRGCALKPRLSVNGIQKADRSFGSVMVWLDVVVRGGSDNPATGCGPLESARSPLSENPIAIAPIYLDVPCTIISPISRKGEELGRFPACWRVMGSVLQGFPENRRIFDNAQDIGRRGVAADVCFDRRMGAG